VGPTLFAERALRNAASAAFPLVVDPRGLEPLTSWLPAMRSTS
jgi:hypothetical protein